MKFPIFLAALLSTAAHAADVPKIDPAKPAIVTLSVQDWQWVLSSVVDSERVSARDANRIAQSIVNQVHTQTQPQTPAKK